MKILFITDLHGDKNKYAQVKALQDNVDVVIHGGDMLPKGKHIARDQCHFLSWLKKYFSDFKATNIVMPGNDDLKAYIDKFKELEEDNVKIIGLGDIVKIDQFEFIGYPNVIDSIFALKDWKSLDRGQSPFKEVAYRSELYGEYARFFAIDPESYFEDRHIDADLSLLPTPKDWSKTIFVSHSPPKKFGLGVAYDRVDYGSYSILDFIERKQPFLSFHGHIHESPQVSGVFMAGIGNTVCFQPGQRRHKLSHVIVDTEDVIGGLVYDV